MYSVVLLMALNTSAEVPSYYPCYGYSCYSYCSPCYSYCYPCYSYCCPCYSCPCYYYPAPATTEGKEGEKKKGGPAPKPEGETSLDAATALITVNLPEDARLLVDGSPTTSTSATRVFITPELPAGKTYHYTLKADALRDGKPVTVSQTVAVEPGKNTDVTLTFSGTSVAQR